MATLATASIQILSALNINPATSRMGDFNEFLFRAQRDARVRSYTLEGRRSLFVFAGVHSADPDDAWPEAFSVAHALIPASAWPIYDTLGVCWCDANGNGYAAAAQLSTEAKTAEPGAVLARSWTDPATWKDPRLRPELSPAAGLELAIENVRTALASFDALERDAAKQQLVHAMRLVDVALLSQGGEAIGPGTDFEPPEPAKRAVWLAGYRASIGDEWHRIGRGALPSVSEGAAAPANGALSGRKIFLSYARTDGPDYAWPIHGELKAAGATVWFDQIERVDQGQLNRGFLDVVEQCDTFIACATDEFFERAGYGVQELAWALKAKAGGTKLNTIIVTGDETLLPNAVRDWTVIRRHGLSELPAVVAKAEAKIADRSVGRAEASQPATDKSQTLPYPMPSSAELALRRDHVARYMQWSGEPFRQALIEHGTGPGQRALAAIRRAHEGLGWDGRLKDWNTWPDDSSVRDVRWRLSSLRLILDLHLPAAGWSAETDQALAEDMDILSTLRAPQLTWAACDGWDDVERRFALRNHLGALRQFAQILDRGLYGGAVGIKRSRIHGWQRGVTERRREILDDIVEMRLAGRWSWRPDPPAWDTLYRAWDDFLSGRKQSAALRVLEATTRQSLSAGRPTLAPAIASLVWRALRTQQIEHVELKDVPLAADAEFSLSAGVAEVIPAPTSKGEAVNLSIQLTDPADVVLRVASGAAQPTTLHVRADNYCPSSKPN